MTTTTANNDDTKVINSDGKRSGFVGFLENLLLAKSVRHGFLLYFIIFNLDLILTILGKGHIVKDLARIIPGIFFGTIETSLIENCVYKGPIYNAENVSTWWRFVQPLLFGFGVPIGFDVIQRLSIRVRDFVKTKLKINISQDALKEETNQTIIKLNSDIKDKDGEMVNLKKIIKEDKESILSTCFNLDNIKDLPLQWMSNNESNLDSAIEEFCKNIDIDKITCNSEMKQFIEFQIDNKQFFELANYLIKIISHSDKGDYVKDLVKEAQDLLQDITYKEIAKKLSDEIKTLKRLPLHQHAPLSEK